MKKPKQDSPEVAALKEQLAVIGIEKDKAVHLWREEAQKSAKALSVSVEADRMAKQLRVIQYISAGRASEAILEILTPLPLLFKIDVQFADDNAAMAAQKEMFDGVKARLVDNINSLELKGDREPSH